MTGDGSSLWRRQRPSILAHRARWIDDLVGAGTARSAISIEVHPETDPGPTACWNWWIAFMIDDHDIDAIVQPDLAALLFEDEGSVFDDHVPLDDVIGYLVRRVRTHHTIHSRGR